MKRFSIELENDHPLFADTESPGASPENELFEKFGLRAVCHWPVLLKTGSNGPSSISGPSCAESAEIASTRRSALCSSAERMTPRRETGCTSRRGFRTGFVGRPAE